MKMYMGENIKVYILNSKNEVKQTIHFDNQNSVVVPSAVPSVVPLHLDKAPLHLDDTIEIVKKKIVVEMNKTSSKDGGKIGSDEIYLFGHVAKKLNLLKIYQFLTEDENKKITPTVMKQVCLNLGIRFSNQNISVFEDFKDCLEGDKRNQTYSVAQPVGIELSKQQEEPDVWCLFPVNPMHMVMSFNKETNYFEQKLLIEYLGENVKEMYVCLAKDTEENKIESETNLFKNYFPNLYEKKIASFELLREKRPSMIEETEHYSDDLKKYKMIDTLDATNTEKEVFAFDDQGIQAFTMYLLPDVAEKQIPSLEIIFKNIHATKNVPFIYYPTNINNTFRLYCDRVSTNGKKIPFLDKTRIMRLWREIDKNKKISGLNKEYVKKKHEKITLFIQSVFKENKLDFFMDFKYNGVITIYSEKLETKISVAELNQIMVETVNPILESINVYLNETGFQLNTYSSIENNPNIKIENIIYKFKTNITDNMKIKEVLECSSSLFLPISIETKHAELIYKRMSQFKRTNAKLFYVFQQIEQFTGDFDMENKIIKGLMKNFSYITEPEAKKLFRTGLEQYNKSNMVLPGFFTVFDINERKEMTVEIQSISHLFYLKFIKKYIIGLLKISSNMNATHMVCNKKDEDEIEEEEDFIVEEESYEIDDEGDNERGDDEDDEGEGKMKKKIGYYDDDEEQGQPQEEEEQEEEEEQQEEEEQEEEKDEGSETEYNLPNKQKKTNKQEKISTNILKRLQNQAPKMFNYKENNAEPYSRKCLGDNKPVILTQNEKDTIDTYDKKYQKSYEKALMYEYDKNTQFYFICPRYWSVAENRSISEAELEEGLKTNKFKLINRFNEKKQTGNVYEFTAHNKKKGNRIPELKSIKNPAGMSLPCCYEVSKKDEKEKRKPLSEYISEKDPPLDNGRLGFLPSSLELFFNIQRNDFMNLKKPRMNVPFLLRYGVHDESRQLFLSCFADLYNYIHNTVFTVADLIKQIEKGIDLDKFIRLHNSSLVSVFKPLQPDYSSLKNKIDLYQNTEFYKRMDLNDDNEELFLLDTIASYENFIKYIKDPAITKDHTFLWDVLTMKNEALISRSINLIVIEIAEDDGTEKIKVLCPSSVYSSHFYDKHKESFILMKKNEFYEPICIYMETKENNAVVKQMTKTFNTQQLLSMKMNNLVGILDVIYNNIYSKCSPVSTSASTSLTKRNIVLRKLYDIIREKGEYTIKCQVLNFNHKAVGLYIASNKTKHEIFIPCYPSEPLDKIINITYIDNKTLWKSYDETLQELETVYTLHDKQILCKPIHVVVERNKNNTTAAVANAAVAIQKLVVGILTETNQFIQVIERPYDRTEHTLPIIEQSNTNTIDKIIATTGSKEDTERVKTVNTILLEGQFYAAFRTTLRSLLNDYSHRFQKKEILKYIETDTYFYKDKIALIQEILRDISKKEVQFSIYDMDVLSDITSCIGLNEKKCSANKFCVVKRKPDQCILNIPKTNLVNGENNADYYYVRLADELLRYNRIRLYMMENTINMVDIEYKIHTDELVIVENLLLGQGKNTVNYFDNLETFNRNKYIHAISYENAQPYSIVKNVKQKYGEALVKKALNKCVETEVEVIGNKLTSVWRQFFVGGKEIIFKHQDEKCTFEVLLHILKAEKQETTIEGIKHNLVKQYKLNAQFLPALMKVWMHDKKIGKTESSNYTIQQVEAHILSDKYFITDIDVWLMADALHLPIVLFCVSGLKLFLNFKKWEKMAWVVLTDFNKDKEYYFIRTPAVDNVEKSVKPEFHLITPMYKPTLLESNMTNELKTGGLTFFLKTITEL